MATSTSGIERERAKGAGVLNVASTVEKWVLGLTATMIAAVGLLIVTTLLDLSQSNAALQAEMSSLRQKVSDMPPKHYENYVNTRFASIEKKVDSVSDQLDRIEAAVRNK